MKSLLFLLLAITLSANSFACQDEALKKVCTELDISTETINEICSNIANNKNFMKSKRIILDKFDINNDGKDEKIISRFSGTMQNPFIQYRLSNGKLVWSEQINFEWKEYGNKYISHLKINNRTYTYNSDSYNGHNVPTHLSIITPQNKEYTLCDFDTDIVTTLIPNKKVKDSAIVCSAVENNELTKIKYIDFNIEPVMVESEFKLNRENRRDNMKKQGNVDYNNDGIENKLLEIFYSNFSIGLDFTYYDELTKNGKLFKKSKESNLLKKMQGISSRSHSTSTRNKFFKYNKKTYYEYFTRDFHEVSMISDGKVKVVCTEKVNVVTSVN